MLQSPQEQKITELLKPTVEGMGFQLVRARLFDGKGRILQIMIDRPDFSGVTLDDCTSVSRAVSVVLDVHDSVNGEYQLEVSSPGIDRPLVRVEDFDHYTGHEAKIVMQRPVNGRKRFNGIIRGTTSDLSGVTMEVEGMEEPVTLEFAEMETAKLVITDALLAQNFEKQKLLKTQKHTATN